MERYTKRLEDGQAVMDCANCSESWNTNPDGKCTALYCRNRLKDRLASIEDILGDEYDLDELWEMVQAKQEGRVRIEEKTYQCPKCGAYRLTPRVDGKFYLCFNCKTQFTKEEAEAALRREQE